LAYQPTQSLNEWMKMLHSIYGLTQNYSKDEYEILSHLSEVSGAFGKYLFKSQNVEKAKQFLPKIFAWAVALLVRMKGDRADLEELLLTKFPTVCPYCRAVPCSCWSVGKTQLDEKRLRETYVTLSPKQKRSLADFQAMFRRIYEASWNAEQHAPGSTDALAALSRMYTRLIEEISEVAEAVRFYHLYPSNFENELADLLAWWFALSSSIHKADSKGPAMLSTEALLWDAYPGICMSCILPQCDCRPGPVRELLSKPSLKDLAYIDGLTQAQNQAAYERDLDAAANQRLPLPIACVRVDLDDFKTVNDKFDHTVGDGALKYLVNVIRQRIRTRDRLFRAGGDEFAVLCPDLSADEAKGMMTRVADTLKTTPFTVETPEKWRGTTLKLTLSVGIAKCSDLAQLRKSFEDADHAAIDSKKQGKDRITISALQQ
jgi:diguanylate cyclase (GGDEF)-like protein